VAASILEGLDEMLTVNRLGLPVKLRRSLACTNSIENMMGTVRRVCRNVKRWRNAAMAWRWTAAGHDGGSQRPPSIESLQIWFLSRVLVSGLACAAGHRPNE
jgi:hypothetical protein